jgi:hypothetical protein
LDLVHNSTTPTVYIIIRFFIIFYIVYPRKGLQDSSEINGDNLNNMKLEAIRHLRNKKREYLKDKINELATNSKNKNIRDLYRGIGPISVAARYKA